MLRRRRWFKWLGPSEPARTAALRTLLMATGEQQSLDDAAAEVLTGEALRTKAEGFAGDRDPRVRLGLASVVRQRPVLSLAAVIDRLIDDPDPAVRASAAAALSALARASSTETERAAVERAVASAALRFEQHRRPEVLEAVRALTATPCDVALADPALRALIADESASIHLALRGLLKRSPEAAGRARAWHGLATPAWSAAAAERLCIIEPGERHERSLAAAPLLLNPRRERAAVRAGLGEAGGDGVLPRPEAIAALSVRARRGVARVWCALRGRGEPATPADRAIAVALLADPEPSVRLALLRAVLGGTPAPWSGGLLIDLTLDADARIARAAAIALYDRARWRDVIGGEPYAAACRQLTRHPHAAVRSAAGVLSRPGLEPIDPIDPAWRVLARRRLRRGRESVLAVLNAGVCSPDPSVRERASAAAELLGMGGEIERRADHAAMTPEIRVRPLSQGRARVSGEME